MKKNILKNKTGFTIIETMVSISLFLVVVMSGMTALLNANLLSQKSRDMRSIMDSLSFAMEDISKNLRTGSNYQCITGAILSSDGTPPVPEDCTVAQGGGGGIYFEAPTSTVSAPIYWTYYLKDKGSGEYSLFKRTIDVEKDITTDIQLVPDEVVFTPTVPFFVSGAVAGDGLQPFVTIKLSGRIVYKEVSSPFSLQTSVSQRLLDNR